MIVRIIPNDASGFRSFQGTILYIANNEQQEPAQERVEFTHVRNLPSTDPVQAYKIMSATALQRDRLKEAAGIPKGGNPAKTLLHHIVISWQESERAGLSKAEMLRAAKGALRYLGLDRNQVYMAAHKDTEMNPHLHIAASRVDLETGKLVDSWKSHRKLSKWALEYDRQRGLVRVKGRELAWLARENGLTPRKAKKTTSKDQYELEKAVKRLDKALKIILKQQKKETSPQRLEHLKGMASKLSLQRHQAQRAATVRLQLAKKNALQKERHEKQREVFSQHFRHRLAHIKEEGIAQKHRTKRRIDKATERWQLRLIDKHEAERAHFARNEGTLLGKVYNRLAYTDWKVVFKRQNKNGERGPSILSKAFTALSDVGHRRATMKTQQERDFKKLHQRRKEMEQRREKRIAARVDKQVMQERVKLGRKLKLLDRLQQQSRDRLKKQWTKFNGIRLAVTRGARETCEQAKQLDPHLKQIAKGLSEQAKGERDLGEQERER